MGFEKDQKGSTSENNDIFQVGDCVAVVQVDENNTQNWCLGAADQCDNAILCPALFGQIQGPTSHGLQQEKLRFEKPCLSR